MMADGVGIGAGVRLLVPPAPQATFPLGVTVVDDTSKFNSTSAVVAQPVVHEPGWWEHESVQTAFKIVATASNIVLQLSPLRMVTEIRMHKSTAGLSAAPLIALTACGYQWSFYGYFAFTVTQNVGFLTLVYANILGLVLGMYYLGIFHHYSDFCVCKEIFFFSALFFLEGIYCSLEKNLETALIVAGLMSAGLSILVSMSPMVPLLSALRAKSLSTLPTDMMVASFVSALLWTSLGLLLNDKWVLLPNVIGLGLGVIQLSALAYIHWSKKSV
jgi:solute carrier family 50 protein (sugar transporter)